MKQMKPKITVVVLTAEQIRDLPTTPFEVVQVPGVLRFPDPDGENIAKTLKEYLFRIGEAEDWMKDIK